MNEAVQEPRQHVVTLAKSSSEQPVIKKIPTHLGLQALAQPHAPARASQLQAA